MLVQHHNKIKLGEYNAFGIYSYRNIRPCTYLGRSFQVCHLFEELTKSTLHAGNCMSYCAF